MSYPNEKTASPPDPSSSAASGKSDSIHHIDTVGANTYARITNPLDGIPREKLMANAAAFARDRGLGHLESEFQKGALVAQDPDAFESLSELTEEDKAVFRREREHRWDQPWQLYYLVIMCSLAAAVQGVSVFLVFTISVLIVWTTDGRVGH
jgi:hypothetical protein